VSDGEARSKLGSIAISPDGKTIVSGDEDGTVRLWDREGKPIGKPSVDIKKKAAVTSVAISSDKTRIVSGDRDGTVRLRDRDGKLVGQTFTKQNDAVQCVGISSDGRRIVSGYQDGGVRAWDGGKQLIGERSVDTLKASSVTSVAISSDGTIVYGGEDGSVRRLLDRGAKPAILLKAVDSRTRVFAKVAITSIAIGPSGLAIAAGREDGTVWLWVFAPDVEPSSPRPITLRGHNKPVTSVAFDDAGQFIVSGSADGAVRLWDREGNAVLERTYHGDEGDVTDDITVVAFNADPKAFGIVKVSRNEGRVWSWRIGSPDTWLPEACKRVRDHPVFADFTNNVAQSIAAELGLEIVELAGDTCLKHGGWNSDEKAAFLVRQGQALAIRAEGEDVRNAVAKFREARELDPNTALDRGPEAKDQDPERVARRLAARTKVDEGARLALQGEEESAIAAYKEALNLDPDVDLDPDTPAHDQDPEALVRPDKLARREPAEEHQLRSLDSDRPVLIHFFNYTDGDCRLMWLDYKGDRIEYRTLRAGTDFYQPTFATHPWVVLGAEDQAIGIYVAGKSKKLALVEIRTQNGKQTTGGPECGVNG
jgi:tetratricopeptide (TPR) repeat protein